MVLRWHASAWTKNGGSTCTSHTTWRTKFHQGSLSQRPWQSFLLCKKGLSLSFLAVWTVKASGGKLMWLYSSSWEKSNRLNALKCIAVTVETTTYLPQFPLIWRPVQFSFFSRWKLLLVSASKFDNILCGKQVIVAEQIAMLIYFRSKTLKRACGVKLGE